MKTRTTSIKSEIKNIVSLENKIRNNKKADYYRKEAAKCHLDAAKFRIVGNYEKSVQSTLAAKQFQDLAQETQIENLTNSITNREIAA